MARLDVEFVRSACATQERGRAEKSLFFLGHDCGPMHLAAAVGIPCVAMFGSFNKPKRWHPMGARHRIIHDVRGIGEITPDAVFAAVDKTMSEIPSRSTIETLA